nr:unnamed protein product [Callosobruchus chinensis]
MQSRAGQFDLSVTRP